MPAVCALQKHDKLAEVNRSMNGPVVVELGSSDQMKKLIYISLFLTSSDFW